jgi:hypothetical protein
MTLKAILLVVAVVLFLVDGLLLLAPIERRWSVSSLGLAAFAGSFLAS